jgi:hypothetical protein
MQWLRRAEDSNCWPAASGGNGNLASNRENLAMAPETIFALIPKVMARIGAVAKGRTHEEFKYAFRSIDDLLAAAQPAFHEFGIFCAPRVKERSVDYVKTAKGRDSVHVVLLVEHHFFGPAGDSVIVTTVGQALDTQDKAAVKAQTAAYKTALIELFAIPAGAAEGEGGDPHEFGGRPADARATEMQRLCREIDGLARQASAAGDGKTPPERIIAEAIGRVAGPDKALDDLDARTLALVARKIRGWLDKKLAATATAKGSGAPAGPVNPPDRPAAPATPEPPADIEMDIRRLAAALAFVEGKDAADFLAAHYALLGAERDAALTAGQKTTLWRSLHARHADAIANTLPM